MSRAHVEKKVEEAVCTIAREEIHQTIPLGDTDHVVLFCGVDADIEICHTDGDEVVLTGTKSSIGLSEADAQASVARIEVRSDQVESFLKTGPHPGEVFTGTWTGEEGHPVGEKMSVADQWKGAGKAVARTSFEPTDLYPEISTREEDLSHVVHAALGRASTRITVIREHMEDMVLPRSAYTEAVQRVFSPNWTQDDQVHGSIGRVDLVLGIPASTRITILRGRHIRVWGLRSDVHILHAHNVELTEIEGDVCLLNTSVRKAKGIRGRFLQSFYQYGGTNWTDHRAKRNAIPDSTLQDIAGEIRLDLGRINLEVSDLKGKVDIRNRFGSTRFHVNTHEDGSTYRIESDSGEVLVFLQEDLIGEMNLTVNTLCGLVQYDALKSLGSLHTSNSIQLITLSTITSQSMSKLADADLYVKTRNGDVTIEKTM